jgi:hypothetical protein
MESDVSEPRASSLYLLELPPPGGRLLADPGRAGSLLEPDPGHRVCRPEPNLRLPVGLPRHDPPGGSLPSLDVCPHRESDRRAPLFPGFGRISLGPGSRAASVLVRNRSGDGPGLHDQRPHPPLHAGPPAGFPRRGPRTGRRLPAAGMDPLPLAPAGAGSGLSDVGGSGLLASSGRIPHVFPMGLGIAAAPVVAGRPAPSLDGTGNGLHAPVHARPDAGRGRTGPDGPDPPMGRGDERPPWSASPGCGS